MKQQILLFTGRVFLLLTSRFLFLRVHNYQRNNETGSVAGLQTDLWADQGRTLHRYGLHKVFDFVHSFLRCKIMLTVSKTSQNHVSVKIFRS